MDEARLFATIVESQATSLETVRNLDLMGIVELNMLLRIVNNI